MRDSALVRRVLAGDRAAAERLVADQYPRIYRFLRHLTGHVEDAEDLTQATFADVWEALAAFRGDSSLSTWLHGIAYRKYTHWLRSQGRSVLLDGADEIVDSRAEAEMDAVLDADLLASAFEQLTPEHRVTLVLHYCQGLCIDEVAAVLGVPAGTVKSRLSIGRGRLRKLLAPAADCYEARPAERRAGVLLPGEGR